MTIKLRSVIVSVAMVGAAAAAVAQSGNLIGERYAAFDLSYVNWDDGGHMTGGAVTLNVPSTIKGLDLGIAAGLATGGYSDYDQDEFGGSAYGVYYSKQQGFTPYARASVGYTHAKGELAGYSASDSSFTYSIGGGVEVPLTDKATLDLRLAYNDASNFDDGDSVTAGLAVNYALSEKMWLRCGYTRDFDNDANTISAGMAFRY